MERLQAALKRRPAAPAIHNLIGEVMLVKNDFAGAEAAFQRAIELDPKLPLLYRNLALARLGQKDSEGAIAAYRAGIEANEPGFVLLIGLATLYERIGRPTEAIEQYEAMLAQAPDSELAVNNLAMLLITYRSEDGASLDRAKDLVSRLEESRNPAFMDTVAWVAYKRGEAEQAVEVLEQVVRMAPDVPIFQYHLGAAYHQKGDKDAAREYLEKAVAADVEFAGRSEAAAMLEQVKGG